MGLNVSIENLSVRFAGAQHFSIRDLNLKIPPGAICAVLGESGAGKTTLLSTLAGIVGKHHRSSCSVGIIRIGEETYSPIPTEILYPKVGYVMHDPYVQISGVRETVRDEILFTLDNLDLPIAEKDRRMGDIINTFRLAKLTKRKPTDLSGGELQRVVLASICVSRPELLLLDEPTVSLDSFATDRLIQFIRNLSQSATIIFTDNTIESALKVATMVVILANGSIIFEGTRQEFITNLTRFSDILPVGSWVEIRNQVIRSPETIINRRVRRLISA